MRCLTLRGCGFAVALPCMLGIACGTESDGEPRAQNEAGAGVSGQAAGGASGAKPDGSSGTGAGGSAGLGGSSGSAGAPAGGASGSAGSGQSDAGPSCTLMDSGPISVSSDNQVIELMRIVSNSGPAIQVNGHSGVVIRNVEIRHSGGPGIAISNSDDIRVENVSIQHTAAPASGANSSAGLNNISCNGSLRPTIGRVRLTRGSSGIYLVECPDSKLSFVEGHDFRGPFPRGQLVQWDKSSNGSLTDFSVINPAGSWPEDNVNIYQSTNVQVLRGFIDGNNSPSGVGVIFDGGPSTGLVEDVDAVHMGNGCFSDYEGGEGVIFRRTRCRDNICSSQGRGTPLSNALMWSGHPARTTLRIEQSSYFAACNPSNIVWPRQSFQVVEVEQIDFTPRAPIQSKFCWE